MDQTYLRKIRTSLLVPQQGTISPARLEYVLNATIKEAIRQGAENAANIKTGTITDDLVNSCLRVGAEAAESYHPARNLPV